MRPQGLTQRNFLGTFFISLIIIDHHSLSQETSRTFLRVSQTSICDPVRSLKVGVAPRPHRATVAITHSLMPSLPPHFIGEISPSMVKWLSSIEDKDLNSCGKFVLTGDMSMLSITKINLSNMNTLEGK